MLSRAHRPGKLSRSRSHALVKSSNELRSLKLCSVQYNDSKPYIPKSFEIERRSLLGRYYSLSFKSSHRSQFEAPLACQLKCTKVKKRYTACTLTVEIRLKVVYLFSNDIPCWGTELSAFSPKSLHFNWHFEECFDSFRKHCTKQNSSHIFDNKWWLLKKEIF